MFYHNINPDLLTLGPFHIRFYGIVYALGFLLGYFILRYYTSRGKIKNFKTDDVDSFMFYLIIGSIFFARLFEILFYEPGYYFSNPIKMFFIWEGGLSFHGGLVGAIIITLIYANKKKVEFYDLADILVIPFAIVMAFGRIANFINGELWGTVSNLPWCVDYSQNQYIYNPPEGCRHPSQLYESLYNFVLFFILLAMHKERTAKSYKKGFIFWMFVLLYGVFRFIENFWRDDIRFLGISVGQYLSIIMIIAAVVFLWKDYWRKR